MIKKLARINETILDCLDEKNEIKIVKAFTDVGVKILEANYGFVWLRQSLHNKWTLVYKTHNLPFQPHKPRLTGMNYKAMMSGNIEYIKKFKNTPSSSHAGKYIKSFVIIPMSYRRKTYGTIVLCFKKSESFSAKKKILSTFLGNGIAQVMTIHRSSEKAEKLKETKSLLSSERRRTEFIANATHELRTPLAIMKGYIDLALMNKEKSKPVSSTLRVVNREIDLLSKTLKDLELMTVSESSSKHITDFRPVDLLSILKNISIRLKPLAAKKHITIKIKTGKVSALPMLGDKIYLEKLFLNLMKNAITYGKNGGKITVQASKNKNMIHVGVADDGIGISKEDMLKIFQRFYRADKSHSEARSGLGLAIAKWAAELHGGKIIVTSIEGKGSIFTVSLPVKGR